MLYVHPFDSTILFTTITDVMPSISISHYCRSCKVHRLCFFYFATELFYQDPERLTPCSCKMHRLLLFLPLVPETHCEDQISYHHTSQQIFGNNKCPNGLYSDSITYICFSTLIYFPTISNINLCRYFTFVLQRSCKVHLVTVYLLRHRLFSPGSREVA